MRSSQIWRQSACAPTNTATRTSYLALGRVCLELADSLRTGLEACCLFSPMSLYLKCKYVMSSCRCMTTPYLRHSVKRLLLADGKSLILTYVWGKEGWSNNTTTFNFVYFTPLAFPVFNAFPKNDKKGNKTMERSIIFGSKCSLS